MSDVRSELPELQWVLALESGESGAPDLSAAPGIDSLGEVPVATVDIVPVRDTSLCDPLQIIYASGTTGDPKGIVGDNQRFGGTCMLGFIFGYQDDERPYTGLSFTHGNAQATALCPALMSGHRAVCSRRFTKAKLWDVCRRYQCTSFSLLGGIATAISSEPAKADDIDNPVRMVVSGGMPAAIWQPFEQRFGVQVFEF